MKHRILSALLAGCCACALLPVTAFAAAPPSVQTGTFRFLHADSDEPAEEPYYYSDDYFSAPGSVQNPHLMSMSMVLACSAGSEADITALLNELGYEDIQTDDLTDTPTAHTIGTAIAHKNINGQEVVAVVIRGTQYEREWCSNVVAGEEGDVFGFMEPYEKVISRMEKYIGANKLKNVKIWMTGYSRGGAVADLSGVHLNQHLDEFGLSADDLYIYTYEAPLCSADPTVYDNIFCVNNINDFITYVYPASWGLHRNGVAVTLGESKTIPAVRVDLCGEELVQPVGEVAMDAFLPECFDFLSDELSREQYSAYCDDALPTLIDLLFTKPLEDWTSMLSSGDDETPGFMDYAKQSQRFQHLMKYDVYMGIMQHNSDKMYAQFTHDLGFLISEIGLIMQNSTLTPMEQIQLSSAITPLLRPLGPVVVRDYLYREGADYSELLPEDYYDPDFDPQEHGILNYEQYRKLANAEKETTVVPAGELSLYHIGTFFTNLKAIVTEHYSETNFALLTALDSYYNPDLEPVDPVEPLTDDDTLCAWAAKDFTDRTGIAVSAVIGEKDGKYLTVLLTDAAGQIADTYVIDVETGIAVNSEGWEATLPQTGSNSAVPLLMLCLASLLIAFGGCAMYIACKRRKNDVSSM